MSLGELSEHRLYWADAVKIDRYRRALASVITPESIVLDLGCGTGLLGLLAAQLGARRVYAVDSGAVLALAEEIAVANGLGDRITYIQSMSTSLELPELVDVVVGDQLGGLAYEPGMLNYYADARRRLLKPDGVCIPEHVRLLLAPVCNAEITTEVDFWRTRPAGFDVSAAAGYAANGVHSPKLNGEDLLADPVVVREQPTWVNESFHVDAAFTIDHSGSLQGIAGMFEAVMASDVLMSNNPRSADHMEHRWNSVYPLPEPIEVQPGDTIRASVAVDLDDDRVTWTIGVDAGGQQRSFKQSTFFASFLTASSLQRLSKEYVPQVGARGAVWRAGLELVADGLSIGELEDRLANQFPDVLNSPRRARQFVEHLVTTAEA
jgi:SAM-dependent methyltransferase